MIATRAQIRNSIARSVRLTAAIAATPVLRAQFSQELARDEGVYNLLFPRGEWHGANLAPIGGSINLDSGILEEMVANWEAAGRPKLPVRKTHRHLDEDVSPVERLELEKAYGWLTDLRVTAQGLEARTEWTDAGRAAVKAGEFSFWSPEWQPKHRDRRTGEVKGWWLSGTALTNDPFFNEMPPVAAAVDPTATTVPTPQHRSTTMNEEQLKQLRASLGLAADASIDTILKAAAEANEAKRLAASAITGEKLTATVKAAVEPLETQLKAAHEETAKLKASLLERDVDALVANAKRGDGKLGRPINETLVATAKKLAVSEGLKAAEDFLSAITPSVPLQAQGVPGNTEETLTAESASKKLLARAEELRKANDPTPMVTAMREMPREALIAEGRTTTR